MARRVGQSRDDREAERQREDAWAERMAERPSWVVTATDPPQFGRVWCRAYTRGDLGTGVPAEDLCMWSTIYQRRLVADFSRCEDGQFVMFEFLPPVESMAVRPEDMTGVVAALRRSGYHARCSDGRGGEYEF